MNEGWSTETAKTLHNASPGRRGTAEVDTLVQWWAGSSQHQPALHRSRLTLLTLMVLCLATFVLGVPRLRIYSHDVFICLDGAWRVVNGQRPVLDFYAVKGPAWFMLYAAALHLAGNNATALGYGSTAVAVITSLWSFLLLRRRMEPAPCFVACVSIVLLAVSPFPLGEFPTSTTFAMTFNRYGFALETLVLLECFLPSSDSDPFWKQFGGGFSSGLACAVMLFIKMSYGMVGLVLLASSLVLRPRERSRWLGAGTGFAIFAVSMLGYLRFDVAAILHEYRILGAARQTSVSLGSVVRRMWQDRFELMPVLLLTLLIVLFIERAFVRRVTLAVAGLMAAVGGTLLAMTNTQRSDLPLMAGIALLLVNEVTVAWNEQKADRAGLTPLTALTLLSFGLIAAGIPLAMNIAGFSYALADKVFHRRPSYQFQEPHLKALEFVEFGDGTRRYDNGELFVQYTEEAMGLVRAHSSASESVRSMTNTNPFSYAMLRPPPAGGAVDIAANFSETSMPPLEFILGNVDLILIRKDIEEERGSTVALVWSRYHDLLETRYVLEAESPHWTLLRKRALNDR